jgi:hypothetical protein
MEKKQFADNTIKYRIINYQVSVFLTQPISMKEKNSLQAMKKTDHAGNGKNSLQTTHLTVSNILSSIG